MKHCLLERYRLNWGWLSKVTLTSCACILVSSAFSPAIAQTSKTHTNSAPSPFPSGDIKLVQEGRRQKAEGRRQEAEGRRKESLYSKLFNLFQLDSYFRHAALVKQPLIAQSTNNSNSSSKRLPTRIQSAVLRDAVRRTSRTVAALRIVKAEERTWPDGCLGLSEPGTFCTEALVPGWEVVVSDGQREWIYRTDDSGKTVKLENRNGDREPSNMGS